MNLCIYLPATARLPYVVLFPFNIASECGCHGGVIDNGFVATGNCKVYSYACDIYCSYYCDDGYVKTASSVYCAGNEQWVPTGTHPSSKERACTVRTGTKTA